MLWGLFGGFAVEGLDLYGALRRRGCWPWGGPEPREVGIVGYAVAEAIRLIIGGGLAGAAATSSEVTSPAGALAVGVAAPLIVERLARAIPLTEPPAAALAALPADAAVSSVSVRADQAAGLASDGAVTDGRSQAAAASDQHAD
ncbi:MAG: hypothetical protein V7637_4347 [Mycobacteriales bacterium]